MVKAEWGTKRQCHECGARFYDMGRDPIVCPKCGTVNEPEAMLKARRPRAETRTAAKKTVATRRVKEIDAVEPDAEDEVLDPEPDEDEDDLVEEEIEEVDEEAAGKTRRRRAGSPDVDEEDDDDDDDLEDLEDEEDVEVGDDDTVLDEVEDEDDVVADLDVDLEEEDDQT